MTTNSYSIKLSPYHKIFYNEWKLDPLSSKYNIVIDQTLANTLNISKLNSALSRLASEHLLFNSHVLEINNEYYWGTNIPIKKLEQFNHYDNVKLFNYVSEPFDLEKGPLYRFAIFNEDNGNYRFVMVIHHLLLDGASVDILISKLSNYYNYTAYKIDLTNNQQLKLIKNTTELFDAQVNKNLDNSKSFWNNKLLDIEGPDLRFLKLNVTLDSPPPINLIKEIRFSIPSQQTLKTKHILRQYQLTTYLYSRCIFAILLYCYTSQNKFAFSYPIAIPGGVDFVCGVKVNTNIIPFIFSDTTSIIDLIDQNKQFIKSLKSSENFNNGYCPIDVIISGKNKNLLQVCFAQTNLKDTPLKFEGAKTLSVNHEFNIDFEDGLFFEQEAKNGIINFRVRYNKLETDEFILTNFIKQYIKLFFDILNDLEQKILNKPVVAYNLLEIEEYNKIIYTYNNNYSFFISEKTLHELFEKQVNLHPNNIAVTYQNIKLNYNELNSKSNKLAHYLRKTYKIKSDDLIAICLDKSENSIISILGILKAGGAYVPIDPDYPIDRIKYILLDTKAKVVLSQSKYKTKLLNIELIFNTEYIDYQEFQRRLIDMPVINPIGISHSSNLCYVIYTSGTTGNPKGVLQQHDNVVRLFTATKKWFDFGVRDIWLFFHSYVFDFSVWEIWGALLHGGKLVIPRNEDVKDFFNLYKLCTKEEITVLNQTPTAFYQFSEIATKYPLLEHLRYVIFGGEKLNITQLKSWFNHYKNKAKLINMYGITETTVHVTYKLIEANQLFPNSLIGNVIPDQKAYILNKHQYVLPIGAIGELYVGGAGLARGYLNKIKLTQEKFILNPFQTSLEKMANINSRLYRSGDLVRMLPNGELEYIGRIDHQVKIRGYRIELGEIETVLNNYPGIKQSVVLVKERKSINNIIDNYLIAYYVSSKKLDIQKINEYLNNYLPMYMIPSYIIHINKLPITMNGKLDKCALPNPEITIKKDEYIAPKNEIEQQICQAFAEIFHLPIEKIGANHDFFKIGGNSILAIQLTSKLQNNFKINVNDIFSLKTPIKIALSVKTTNNGVYENLKKLDELYYHLNNYKYKDKIKAEQKKLKYLESIDKFTQELKPINNILLTGATGYLGCHILFTLLTTTKYNIYLLIRAQSNEHAKNKIYQKFSFYFSINLELFKNRLFILLSDIEKPCLNLNIKTYNKLSKTIDSIIHTAALTKHYGEYKNFYSANVQATINMLNFAKLTKFKDFHHISTISVLNFGYIPDCSYYIFHEDDFNILQDQDNFYVTSKHKAELEVIKYRESGIKASIYRVGNLSTNSKTYKNQENIEDNAFFIKIKTFLNLGLIPQELRYVEISPVDYVALGIVKLFNQTNLINQTYHLFNPNLNDLLKLFSHYKKIKVIIVPFIEFIDVILKHLNQKFDNEQIRLFVLHQGWLQNINLNQITKIEILQDKTNTILDQLKFKWPEISGKTISDLVEKSFNKVDRMIEDDNIFKHLHYTCDKFPANFYWFDTKGVILGLNQKVVSSIGAIQKEDVIGKTLYDIYPQDIANDLLIHIKEVIANKKEIEREHKIKDITTGKYRYYLDTMSPITNTKGVIIGIAGSSFEITAEKEAEKLKIENEKHQIEAEQQQKFREVVGQVNHDIKSPIASLQMLTKQCSHLLPENERNSYNKAITQITDIANNMMNYFKPKNKWEDILKLETNSSLLVSTELLEVLAEKKYEYIKKPISFTYNFSQIGNFAFVNINARTFERMISNVINNAVDALEDNKGIVNVKLDVKDNLIEIIIEDNGKGIPDKIKNKIMNNEAISAGKKDGHGIGLTQVRQVLEKNGGKLNIESELRVGTKITLTFPKAVAPNWIAERIKIEKDSLVVIVDDDPSIHGAWDSRFKVEAREITIKHFEIGEEAVNYLNNLSDIERQKVLLLIDYELLKQPLNGLDIIKKSNIKNAILVTNYYANLEVCEAAGKENIKILPKALSVNIPIVLKEKIISNSKKVDMVWVDDAREFINNLITKYYSHLKVDFYYDPAEFLKDVEQYPLDTKIILDGFYCDDSGFTIIADGITLAKKLHSAGYNNLYLTSSEDIPEQVLPSYVTFISKHDTENMVILDKL